MTADRQSADRLGQRRRIAQERRGDLQPRRGRQGRRLRPAHDHHRRVSIAEYVERYSRAERGEMINRGPVDVIIFAVGEPRFDGKVLAEFKKQAAAGTIRVLDVMVLLKDENGKPWRLYLKDLPAEDREAVGFQEGGMQGLFDTEDADTLFEGMVPGSALVALALEHTWAIDLVNALHDAGVETALNFRVPAPIVEEAFASAAVS
jgi:hypothetical protein